MEHLSGIKDNIMKHFPNKLYLIAPAIILLWLIVANSFWMVYLRDVPDNVRPALKEVLKAYYLSRITGDYWADEMNTQTRHIAGLPQTDRAAFFREIILNIPELQDSGITVYLYDLGDDAEALHAELVRLKNSDEFRKLSERQQQKVITWIGELPSIIMERASDNALKKYGRNW
jgi:hypothetical protein